MEAPATKASRGHSFEWDEDLEVRLDPTLPRRLAVGGGNAVFVCGACFHRRRRVTGVQVAVAGRTAPAIAHRMPRSDLHRQGHPYRSGFWAIVPVAAPARPGTVPVEVGARLDDGSGARKQVATLELDLGAGAQPVAWRNGSAPAEPPVAICMATYDPPAELLRRQLDSIRAQAHRNWVCVISDDCSPEDSYAELEAAADGDPRFVLSRAPRRLGFYSNFERALSLVPAEAAFVALADQDDRWHPDKLRVLVSAIGDNGLAYSDARVVDADGEMISDTYWSSRRTNHTNLASLLISNTITGAASLFRRELLDRALPFPPEVGRRWHDHWLALVALASGGVTYVDRPLYDYVQHAGAVVGHAAANDPRARRATRERVRMLRTDWRLVVAGWCWKYFGGVCGMVLVARVLEQRCGALLAGRKRRAVRWFAAIDRSPLGYAWLSLRQLRRLVGLNETLGAEGLFLRGLAWRRVIAALAWRRTAPRAGFDKDASLPREWAPTP